MDFRGHDNVVEVVVFAPIAAYPAIRELAGIPVSYSSLAVAAQWIKYACFARTSIPRSARAHILRAEVEINLSRSGTHKVVSF